MSDVGKIIPWVLSTVLACALGSTWFAMHTQLEQKDAELSDLRGKYRELAVEANRKLEEANKRYNDTVVDANKRYNATVAEANQKIHAASLPEVGIQVGFRKALLSSGNVAILRNFSGQTIAITVAIERPSSGQNKGYELTLDPNQIKEIGGQEGWAFVSGDTIKISQPAHKDITFTKQ